MPVAHWLEIADKNVPEGVAYSETRRSLGTLKPENFMLLVTLFDFFNFMIFPNEFVSTPYI